MKLSGYILLVLLILIPWNLFAVWTIWSLNQTITQISSNIDNLSEYQKQLKKFTDEHWTELDYPGLIKVEDWWDPKLAILKKKCDNCWKNNQTTLKSKKLDIMQKNYDLNFKVSDDNIKITEIKNDKIYEYAPIDRIIIHHTGEKSVYWKKNWIKYMQNLYKMHAIDNGWDDIGYNYLIDMDWNVYEWNSGGKYVIWAHVFWHNFWSVGISLMSNWVYTKKQLESLISLIKFTAKEYDIDITQPQEVRKADLSWYETGWALIAHKEIDSDKPIDPKINMTSLRKLFTKK